MDPDEYFEMVEKRKERHRIAEEQLRRSAERNTIREEIMKIGSDQVMEKIDVPVVPNIEKIYGLRDPQPRRYNEFSWRGEFNTAFDPKEKELEPEAEPEEKPVEVDLTQKRSIEK